MKLQDKINRKIGNKEYRRYYVNLSNETIEKLAWSKGQELESKIRNGSLIVKPR
jgi:hypothetical protein